jgi:hypothetical protein
LCNEIGGKRLLFAPLNATDETVNTFSMSQLTIQISEKGDALIAQLQKEIFQRRRKKVSAEGVIETLIESGAKSQSDKRFAASWQNLVADIEKAAKVAQTHGAKPANLTDAEWALVLAHRTRTGFGEADKPKGRTSPSRSRSTTTKAAAKPRTSRSASSARSASNSASLSSTSSRAKATSSRSKAASSKAKASAKALASAAPVPAPEVAEASPAALGQSYPAVETFPVVDTFSPASPPSAPTTTRRTRTRSTASNGAKPRTNSSPAARRMAKAATRLSIGSTTSKAASAKATPAAPIPASYPSTVDGPGANENPAG